MSSNRRSSGNFSIRSKLIFLMIIILLLMFSLLSGIIFILNDYVSIQKNITSELNDEITPASKLEIAIPKAVTDLEHSVLDFDTHRLQSWEKQANQIDKTFDMLVAEEQISAHHKKPIERALANWRKIKNIGRSIAKDIEENQVQAASSNFEDLNVSVNHVLNNLETIEDQAILEVEGEFERAEQGRAGNISHSSAIILLTFALVIIAGVYLLRSILRPVKELENGVQQVQEGDLKYRIKVFKNDELGQVSKAFNEMTKRLETYSDRLNEIATHDDLTGLYNHREFYNQLENEADLAKRYGLFFSLAMFDIDFFKKVNDKYGHKAGDVVLAAVAGTIKQTARSHDICARYGGEEFAVILPQTHKEDGVIIAKRICAQIASNPIVLDDPDNPVKLTISAGVAEFERNAKDIEGLFNKADSALYNAKETGRNRAVIYRESA